MGGSLATQDVERRALEDDRFFSDEIERLRLLLEASSTLLGSLSVDTMLPQILELAGRTVAADAYALWRREAADGAWRVAAYEGLPESYVESATAAIRGQGDAVLLEEPLVAENIATADWISAAHRRAHEEAGTRAMLVAGLRYGDRVVGTLVFYYRHTRAFTEAEKNAASLLANIAAAAIGTAELYEAQRRLAEDQRFVAEASELLASSLDYEKTLSNVAALAVPLFADWCAIDMLEPDGSLSRLAIAHVNPEKVQLANELAEKYPPDPDAPYGVPNVIRTRQPELFSEISDELLVEATTETPELLELLRELGLRSSMCVPLIARDRVLGAITLVSSVSGRRYTKEDLRLAEDLASRAAFPIDNARLYQERARVAQTLQESLLPPELPEIPGTDLAARYHAAVETVDVGGDFYDIFEAGSRKWGVALGDVSGKGVDAAAVTSLARHTLRAAALSKRTPSGILSILNTALLEQTEHDRFCTGVYAELRPRFGRLMVTVACAGHPPPYIVRSDGTVEALPCEGSLLGIIPEMELTDVGMELGFGDKLVFYTDGVIEARAADGRVFGDGEFERLLHECASRGVAAAADLITNAVIDFQDGRPRDDVALVVIGVKSSIFRRTRPARRRVRLLPRPFEGR